MATAAAHPDPEQTVGEYLRQQRLAAGLTQAELAILSGVARPNVAAIETGGRVASAEMAERLLTAIRGHKAGRPRLHVSPPVFMSIELGRLAAQKVAGDPVASRSVMIERLAEMRSHDDGTPSAWLVDWQALLDRWNLPEIIELLISTDPDDIERRKVSPIDVLITDDERQDAARRARLLWNAARRVS